MPTRGHEGHDMGKPEGVPSHPTPGFDAEHPGYETQDVNIKGIVYFLGGLLLSVAVFFVLCFVIGKVVNKQLVAADGPADRWHPYAATQKQRENLVANPQTQGEVANQIKNTFPTPQLDTDDGNQATTDLHAREDLLLNYYSTDKGTTRIPIGVAMGLIAQRGLGAAPAATNATLMAGDSKPEIQAPLTNGFARTGYELDSMEKRDQQNKYRQEEEGRKLQEEEHKK